MSLLWHVPFVLLLATAGSALAFIPDFGSVDDRAPTVGALFAFFGIRELRADKAMPIFLGAWGLSGLGLNVFAMYHFDSYPPWFLANALVSGMLLGVGAVAVFARLTKLADGGGDTAGDEENH